MWVYTIACVVRNQGSVGIDRRLRVRGGFAGAFVKGTKDFGLERTEPGG